MPDSRTPRTPRTAPAAGTSRTARPTRPVRAPAAHVPVAKTAKLFINGAFVRPENGKTLLVTSPAGTVLRVPQASRKDARDAIHASASAQRGWSRRDPYNRGQILYRVAEMLEAQGPRFLAEGVTPDELAASVDVLVSAAGWSDKVNAVLGEVASPAGGLLAVAECVGVGLVGYIAPEATLVSLCRAVGTALAAGNTLVAVVRRHVGVHLSLGEVLACSDVPPGVVALLTGFDPEVAITVASATAVRGLDVRGAGRRDLAALAADHLCRVAPDALVEPAAGPSVPISPAELHWQTDLRTVWGVAGV